MPERMSLSQDFQNEIVFLLGYPHKVLVANSTHYNRIIVNRMTELLPQTITRVTDILTKARTARTNLDNAQLQANVQRIGDINLDATRGTTYIYQQYERYLDELSSVLDIPRRNTKRNTLNIAQ